MNDYPVVVDMGTILPNALASAAHAFTALLQLGLVLYLLAGAARAGLRGAWPAAALRALLAAGLVLPLAVGAPVAVSVAACAGALGLLGWGGPSGPAPRGRARRLLRAAALGASAVLAPFALWEREDPLALGLEVVTTARDWRAHELAWQLEADATAPKLGELAPDFQLQDPSGRTAVRLADFRGVRPVALIFGSYT